MDKSESFSAHVHDLPLYFLTILLLFYLFILFRFYGKKDPDPTKGEERTAYNWWRFNNCCLVSSVCVCVCVQKYCLLFSDIIGWSHTL